jgi:branched-chain amino acid transport system permease protein
MAGTSSAWTGRAIVLITLACIPFIYHQNYFLHVMGLAMIAATAALGMQLLIGFTGQLSLGQAAFLGIGAYTDGLLTKYCGVPFPLAFIAAGLLAALSSLVLVPITRLRGVYLSVATLGFTVLVFLILLNEEWLTGGAFGVLGIPWPTIGPFRLRGETAMYFLCLVLMAATYIAFTHLINSRFGRALQAIMLDEDAALASGINVTLYKSKSFFAAAMVTGFAGALFAEQTRYLNPNDFSFSKSIEILTMVAVGGIGSLPGAILGGFVAVLLPEYLRAVDQWRLVIYGGALVLLMGLGRGGLAGLVWLAARELVAMLRRSRPGAARPGGAPL